MIIIFEIDDNVLTVPDVQLEVIVQQTSLWALGTRWQWYRDTTIDDIVIVPSDTHQAEDQA